MKTLLPLCLLFCIACGGEDGGGKTENPCEFEDRYLPYQPGYHWTYKVIDLGQGEVTTKTQEITMTTDPDYGEVMKQTTTKGTGKTVSVLKVQDNAVIRLRQEDFDMLGELERTSVYDSGQTRLSETMEHLTLGAEWDEKYTVTLFDELGVETSKVMRNERWVVLGVDVDCESTLGNFSCLHIGRTRTEGGVSAKQFFYAKGIGKVKEINANQVEDLTACE